MQLDKDYNLLCRFEGPRWHDNENSNGLLEHVGWLF